MVFTRISGAKFDRIVTVLVNDGNQFSTMNDIITGFGNNTNPIISIGDFNNNGADDILLVKRTSESAADEIYLYENNFLGGFSISNITHFPLCSNIGFVNLSDLNNDGFLIF